MIAHGDYYDDAQADYIEGGVGELVSFFASKYIFFAIAS